MNVKFKMPKLGHNMTARGIAREIMMSTVATTISIILTFGTAYQVEKWQKRKAGRETAMMVIHDIDDNVRQLREVAKDEEKGYDLIQYALEHIDELNDFPNDTIEAIYVYLSEGYGYEFNDSEEKIFHSSQDSWKNIDNAQVIGIFEEFFQERHQYQTQFNSELVYKKPISREEEYDFYLASPSNSVYDKLISLLSQKLKGKKTQLYLAYSISRQRTFISIANDWQRMSDQCKFAMGITDEELAAYIEKKNRTGRPIKEKELIDTWEEVASSEDAWESIEFKKDHTFTHLKGNKQSLAVFKGQIEHVLNMKGTWAVVGDSLIREYAKGSYYTLDTTHITYEEALADSVRNLIARFKEKLSRYNESNKDTSTMGRRANAAFIDRSGNKIEMSKTKVNEDGKEEKYSSYMVRKRK